MASIKVEIKIRAFNNHKRHQLLNNLFLYSLTVLTFSLFCSSPFWFPYLFSSMKVFLFVSLREIASILFSYKFVFIVGNLIVVALLIGQSKIFSSNTTSPSIDDLYDEYVLNSTRSLQSSSTTEVKREIKIENYDAENVRRIGKGGENAEAITNWAVKSQDIDGNNIHFASPAEELSKRADDYIARVNKERKLEARLLLYGSEEYN
ncbi:hypothetical protein CIPAW_11G004900 [Carya illinoinensis]|uniref:DUF4408 domain-containing protein n=1 Tax=Carya illinoinensis TaxID=32201 RepID=A0A8T1NTH1_CARIL|nr:hypothetical protein CIPAW_11G004900 [Carya illinoinensis]